MIEIKKKTPGLLMCLAIAIPSWFIGIEFPVIGGAVIALIIGMGITLIFKNKRVFEPGIQFVSKRVLQLAIILLGFGMDLNVVMETGKQSLPIIVATISTSLVISFAFRKVTGIPSKMATLIGVGSSICGGSAVVAVAPVIDADDDEVAQAISVIFLFNILAAVLFPALGIALNFSTASGEAFGVFVGTAVNDTSSVTAIASTWDSMWDLGSATLDKAVTVKLTRTLTIIPISLALAFMRTRKEKATGISAGKVSISRVFPVFILLFTAASVITTVAVGIGVTAAVFSPFKTLSKFLVVLAMASIGLNSNIIKLVKSGIKPILLGACCWVGIIAVSLILQSALKFW